MNWEVGDDDDGDDDDCGRDDCGRDDSGGDDSGDDDSGGDDDGGDDDDSDGDDYRMDDDDDTHIYLIIIPHTLLSMIYTSSLWLLSISIIRSNRWCYIVL